MGGLPPLGILSFYLTKLKTFDIIKKIDEKEIHFMNIVTVKQSDIQELLCYAQQNKTDFYIAGYGTNPLIAFLEKYANNFTYKTYKIGGLDCTKKSDFKSTFYKGFCTLEEFKAERQQSNSSNQGLVEIIDFEDYSYLTRDEVGTFLIEFYDFGIQNPHEFAEVSVADLESLVSFAEKSNTPKYIKLEDGSFALNVLFAFVSAYTLRELHYCTVESTDKNTGFTTRSVSLMSLAKFKELWYKLNRKYECDCKQDWGRNCDCEGYEDGYDLTYICKVKSLKDGHTFTFETPTTTEKYTHWVFSPSELS